MIDEMKTAIRQAVADYMRSEGCSFCIDAHKEAERILAGLLDVPMYSDGIGYDFEQFSSFEINPLSDEE